MYQTRVVVKKVDSVLVKEDDIKDCRRVEMLKAVIVE